MKNINFSIIFLLIILFFPSTSYAFIWSPDLACDVNSDPNDNSSGYEFRGGYYDLNHYEKVIKWFSRDRSRDRPEPWLNDPEKLKKLEDLSLFYEKIIYNDLFNQGESLDIKPQNMKNIFNDALMYSKKEYWTIRDEVNFRYLLGYSSTKYGVQVNKKDLVKEGSEELRAAITLVDQIPEDIFSSDAFWQRIEYRLSLLNALSWLSQRGVINPSEIENLIVEIQKEENRQTKVIDGPDAEKMSHDEFYRRQVLRFNTNYLLEVFIIHSLPERANADSIQKLDSMMQTMYSQNKTLNICRRAYLYWGYVAKAAFYNRMKDQNSRKMMLDSLIQARDLADANQQPGPRQRVERFIAEKRMPDDRVFR